MPESKETKTKEKAPRKAATTPRRRSTVKKDAAAPEAVATSTPTPAPAAAPAAKKTRTRAPRPAKAAEAPAAPAEKAEKPAEKPPVTVVRKSSKKAAPAPVQKPAEEKVAKDKPAKEKAAAPAAPAQQESTPEPAPGYAVPETVGGHEPQGGGHRKRRRRNRRGGGDGSQAPGSAPRHTRVDVDELVRRAWKIFLGEVTEEGLALMDDKIAAEAARRSFRVAELFLLEAAAHRPAPAPAPEQKTEPAPGSEPS